MKVSCSRKPLMPGWIATALLLAAGRSGPAAAQDCSGGEYSRLSAVADRLYIHAEMYHMFGLRGVNVGRGKIATARTNVTAARLGITLLGVQISLSRLDHATKQQLRGTLASAGEMLDEIGPLLARIEGLLDDASKLLTDNDVSGALARAKPLLDTYRCADLRTAIQILRPVQNPVDGAWEKVLAAIRPGNQAEDLGSNVKGILDMIREALNRPSS